MGANIGDNVIIGAGSVVSGRIPPNSVCAGNPARVICSLEHFLVKSRERFEDSARCYCAAIKRKKGNISENDIIIYKSLFSENDEVQDFIQKGNFCGLESKEKINMENYRKYKSFNDFLESIL